LRAGADPDLVARELRGLLPNDVQVFTRPELAAHEISFWTTRTGTGLIFGSGLIVAFVVGIMVLYQTLATQITRQLPQFATLKAIGYSNGFLNAIVLIEAVLVMLIAFVPAFAVAIGIYAVLRLLIQLGFGSGFFNASLGVIRQLDGDLFVLRASKYRFGDEDAFARRDLDPTAGVTGVASVVPLYASWQSLFWKEPGGDKSYLVQAFAFDPDRQVFLLPEVNEQRALLKQEDAVLVDRRA